jgi:hypothetical protein
VKIYEHLQPRPQSVLQRVLGHAGHFFSPSRAPQTPLRPARPNTLSGAPSPSLLHLGCFGRPRQSEKLGGEWRAPRVIDPLKFNQSSATSRLSRHFPPPVAYFSTLPKDFTPPADSFVPPTATTISLPLPLLSPSHGDECIFSMFLHRYFD